MQKVLKVYAEAIEYKFVEYAKKVAIYKQFQNKTNRIASAGATQRLNCLCFEEVVFNKLGGGETYVKVVK